MNPLNNITRLLMCGQLKMEKYQTKVNSANTENISTKIIFSLDPLWNHTMMLFQSVAMVGRALGGIAYEMYTRVRSLVFSRLNLPSTMGREQ